MGKEYQNPGTPTMALQNRVKNAQNKRAAVSKAKPEVRAVSAAELKTGKLDPAKMGPAERAFHDAKKPPARPAPKVGERVSHKINGKHIRYVTVTKVTGQTAHVSQINGGYHGVKLNYDVPISNLYKA